MIETCKPQDLAVVMEIWLHTNIAAHPFIDPGQWHEAAPLVHSLLPTADLYVYREAGLIQGFIGVTEGVYIAGLFVRATAQAQGIGRKLLEHCKARYPRLELDVFVENERAVRFYQRQGFVRTASQNNPDFNHREYHLVWRGEETKR